jgi:hypothetical protein
MCEENYKAKLNLWITKLCARTTATVPYVGGVLEVWPYLGATANRSGLPSGVMAGVTWRVSEPSVDCVWNDIGDPEHMKFIRCVT